MQVLSSNAAVVPRAAWDIIENSLGNIIDINLHHAGLLSKSHVILSGIGPFLRASGCLLSRIGRCLLTRLGQPDGNSRSSGGIGH